MSSRLVMLAALSVAGSVFAQTLVDQWRFTFQAPAGEWHATSFDDSGWRSGPGGFGTEGTPCARIGTRWDTPNIWLRKRYQLENLPKKPVLLLHHDDDLEIFINGIRTHSLTGHLRDYEVITLDDQQQALLKSGENTLAVHCRQFGGGQFVDVHLVDIAGLAKNPIFEFSGSRLIALDPSAVIPPTSVAFAELVAGRKLTQQECRSADRLWAAIEGSDELLADWLWQDFGEMDIPSIFLSKDINLLFDQAVARACAESSALLGDRWKTAPLPADSEMPAKLEYYRMICVQRRQARLSRVKQELPEIVFARHFVMGGSHYAYTEALSDAQSERQFSPGGKLCKAEWQEGIWQESTLLETDKGIIRDVDVNYAGNRMLFAWKKSDREDDYHLYEMELRSGQIRQLTEGLGIADYEGCYLPDGNILFNSTRCMQIVDCWWTEVSNLYRCDADGKNIYRMAFDQVHVNYPTVTADGTILYTRWEYNDRSQMFPQPLFQMAPDGTLQSAVYGENSWFPTTIIHARRAPGSQKIFAIATGHHSRQPGALIMVDPSKGRQENSGIQLLAPMRETKAERIDAYGQSAALFAYPYPLDDESMLVMCNPAGWGRVQGRPGRDERKGEDRRTGFGIYWMNLNGGREILVSRQGLPCGRPVPLRPRQRPAQRPSTVDYRNKEGTFYIQDVYVGEPMAGVARGTAKTLRVIGIDYRVAGIGNNGNAGAGGGALVSTPVAVGNGAWDPKILIGDAKIYADGSAYFKAEARGPLYFMVLDEQGRMIQSMRSWTMLQPGENASCVGCHESKNSVPSASARPTLAMAAGVQRLAPINAPRRGFSFTMEVQPILDQHCIKCHDGKDDKKPDLTSTVVEDPGAKRAWSKAYLALTHSRPDDPKRPAGWRGNADHKVLNWISAGSTVELLPPNSSGSSKSTLFTERLDNGHCETITADEVKRLAMWVDLGVPFCADYVEANLWNDAEKKKHAHFQAKRDRADQEDQETLKRLINETP
ncbi:MAG: hypothetical protein PHO37_02195 [Kiritimatiellae bacterium]|nr:hypothetical protein [Kiritimatiellia bacterium]